MWIFQWFITLFLYNFPLEFTKRLWDFTICKKEFAPVLISLGIIKALKNEIMEIDIHDEIDFMEFTEQFRDIEFCRQFLDLKKIFGFANSITKSEIDKAISQTKCVANPYRIYFASSPLSQRDQWKELIKRLEAERQLFNSNP